MTQRSAALAALQEELLQVKQQVAGLHLKKSTPAQSPDAPFPIAARAEVAAPLTAERYDVAGFTLVARLHSGCVGSAATVTAADSSHKQQQQEQVLAAVEVEVVSGELPRALRDAMASELHRLWAASGPAPGKLNLALLWSTAQQRFVHLITLLPELLEPYQSEDAWGSTVRRWAILNDQASVSIDASVPSARPAAAAAAGKPAAGGTRPAAAAGVKAAAAAGPAAASAVHTQPQQQQQPAAAASGAQAAAPLPRALQQELEWLQKRYGLSWQHCPERTGDPTAAAAAELAGMHLSSPPAAAPAGDGHGRQAAAAEPAAATADVALELTLRPTDPEWDALQPLHLRGWVSSSAYPAAGSLALLVVSTQLQQQPLPLLQQQVLGKLLAAEVAAVAGRPGALRAAVRYVENHAGHLLQQAEDIAAEVARRRAQQQQQQQQVAAGSAAVQGRAATPVSPGKQGAAPAWAAAGGSSASSEYDDDGAAAGDYTSSSGGSSDSSGSRSNSDDSEWEEGEGAAAAVAGNGASRQGGGGGGGSGGHSDAVLPLELQLDGLQLVDCDALELLRLNLQLTCTRCRRGTADLSFATAAVALPSEGAAAGGGTGSSRGSSGSSSGVLVAVAECGTCHAPWRVEVAPKLVHERNNVLAHVKAEGCTPVDLLPSMLAGQCSQCTSSAAFRSITVGGWNERTCSRCHCSMRFQFTTALFVQRTPGRQQHGAGGGQAGSKQAAVGGAAAAAAEAAAFNGLLQLGQPLPDRGTCRHYRHSYRWLRFPCCGKRFPCDLCHEELTDGHDMKWATRMVCGYCSLEQPVAAQCKSCGKKLAATAAAPSGRRTRFWEGGKGQRDPNKLHPNDPRRYRGKFKTRSKKSQRVGQEGKERRERQAAS